MYKKTIEYLDYNGLSRKEDFYFNLDEAEITKMELGISGGLSEMIKRIVSAQDVPSLVDEFDSIICASYGVKSPDGKRFVKSKELTDEFKQTRAYSNLFMELISDADASTAFINGIVPKSAVKKLEENKDLVDKINKDLGITAS